MTHDECHEFHTQGTLQCYVDGEVDDRQYTVVTVHLQTCGGCRSEVDSFVMLKRALRRQHVADPEAVARLCSFAALLTRGCR
jgi:anti-sigma factor RsiW